MSPDNLRRFCQLVFRTREFSAATLAEILALAGVHWSDCVDSWMTIRGEFDAIPDHSGLVGGNRRLYRIRIAPPVK